MLLVMSRVMHSGFFINVDKVDGKIKYLLFLFWPIGAFVYSLRCLQSKSSRVIFFLICAAFGLCIECKDESFDMVRITESFLSYRYSNYEELKILLIDFFDGVGVRDLYEFMLYWVVNQFTANEHIFWMIASAVYAFFYIKSLSFILDDIRFRSCLMGFMIVLMFTMPQPIFTVTGLRFWTAGWLATLCTLQVFLNRNYKYCIILLLTPLIHVMYWIYVVLFLIAILIISTKTVGEKILIVVFFISYPLSYLSMSFAFDIIGADFLPTSLQLMALSYTDESQMSEFNKQGTGWFWLSDIFNMMLDVYYLIMSCFFVKFRNLIIREDDKKLFLFILLIYSFSNFTSIIPHLGIRFMGFAKILLPLLWFRVFGLNRYKGFILLYLLCAFFYVFKTRLIDHYGTVLDVDFLYNSFIVMIIDGIS